MSDSPTPANSANALTRLHARQPVFGFLQTIPVPTITELALWCGFDFVILDCEHGVIDEAGHLACLQVVSGADAFSAVRVRPGDCNAVCRYLDFGADAVMMPDLRTAGDAAAFVSAAQHGPNGTRSSSGSGLRWARYGLGGKKEDARPLLIGMIESAEAVSNIDMIVATPSLDGLVIGPHDLSADLGCALTAPAYKEAFETVERAASRAGLFMGTGAHAGFPVERLLAAGHCFILSSVDILALRDGLRQHRASAESGTVLEKPEGESR